MSGLTAEEKQVLYLIETDLDHARFFFAGAKDLKWFSPLKEKGYFKPEQIKFDDRGYALFWQVLDYLERVSEQLTSHPEYGKELIAIIEETVQFSKNKKQINNYHVWWFCVKILNNIPIEIIKDHLPIDQFRGWLFVWTAHSMGSDLAISDIGEKLLPKLLSNNSTIEYAETIVDVITRIKPGEKTEVFGKRQDARLAWHSYWIMETFKKHHQTIARKCSMNVVWTLANKLNRTLEYKQRSHYVNIDVAVDVFQIEVLRVSKDGAGPEEIEFEEGKFQCVIKQFAPDQLGQIDRQNDFWALHNITPQIELKRFNLTANNNAEMVSSITQNLPSTINWTGADQVEQKIGYLFSGLYSDYSHIWIKSLKSGGREHSSGAEEVLAMILRDVLLEKCEADKTGTKEVLVKFLSDKYGFPVFKRLALLTIDKYWPDYTDLFSLFMDSVKKPFEESDLEVELQDVLRNHNLEFSETVKARVLQQINDVPKYYVEKGEKLVAYWKYKWLSPLKDNAEFASAYQQAKDAAEPKDGAPYEPERESVRGGFVTHKSPISKEEILKKPTAELVRYLSEFQGADFWGGTFEGEPDKEGLAEAFQQAVKEDPSKFTSEIDLLSSVDYYYIHRFYRGIKEAWNAGKDIDWDKVINFSLKYFAQGKEAILKKAIKAQGEDAGGGKYIWVVEAAAELIADGCKKDERAFDPKYFEKVDQIFDLIVPLLKGEKRPDTQRDALTYALNTTLGRVIMSFVSFSLRVARATKNKEADWGKKKYTRFNELGIEGYIWFGYYVPQMLYLDEAYTKSMIQELPRTADQENTWQLFMEGFLSGGQLYPVLFALMRENYIKALQSSSFSENIDDRLVEHITYGFLYYGETLQEKNPDGQTNLFYKMLSEAAEFGKFTRLLHVPSFFWSLTGRTLDAKDKNKGEDNSKEFREKVLEYWAWTYEQRDYLKAKLGKEYSSFLARLSELTILLENISETSEKWIMLSAPYIDHHHNATFFIEYLTKFKDEDSLRRVGSIFLYVLESVTPMYKSEDIQEIVERLYGLGKTDPTTKNVADKICNTYGRRGVHFLKEIWQKNQ